MKATIPRLRSLTVGLRREDPARIWERRAPLTPDAVYDLTKDKRAEVHVESCERRIFKDEEYKKVCFQPKSIHESTLVVLFA